MYYKIDYNKIFQFLVFSFFVLFSIGVFIVVISDINRPEYYKYLYILPLSFLVILFISYFINNKLFSNLFNVVVFFLYFVRNVLSILFLVIGNYYSEFKILNNENVLFAIGMLTFETLCVLIFLSLLTKNFKKIKKTIINKKVELKDYVIILIGVLFVVIVLVIPDLKASYTSAFSAEGIRGFLINNTNYDVGSYNRSFFTLIQIFFPIFYFLMCSSIIMIITVTKLPIILKNLLYVIIIFAPFLFMNGGDANTFFTSISLMLFTILYRKEKPKSFFIILFLIVILLFVYIFVQSVQNTYYYNQKNIFENISYMFQAYFPGVTNMAGVYNVTEYSYIEELFYDIYSTIPFRNTIFGLSNYVNMPNLYTIQNDALSHIMPCHSYIYLGFLSPFLSCLYYYFAFEIYKKYTLSNSPYICLAYILLMIYLVVTPIMYNSVIFLSHLFSQIIPIFIITKILNIRFNYNLIEKGLNLYEK